MLLARGMPLNHRVFWRGSALPVTQPEPLAASFLFNPIVWAEWPQGAPDRNKLQRQHAVASRYAANKPMTLADEVGIGSIVRLAIGDDGLLCTVQIVQAAWADPFAMEFAEAAD